LTKSQKYTFTLVGCFFVF